MSKYTLTRRALMFLAQDGCCSLCGEKMDPKTQSLNVDHIRPKSKGGGERKNLSLVHEACNESKGNNIVPVLTNAQRMEDFDNIHTLLTLVKFMYNAVHGLEYHMASAERFKPIIQSMTQEHVDELVKLRKSAPYGHYLDQIINTFIRLTQAVVNRTEYKKKSPCVNVEYAQVTFTKYLKNRTGLT